MAVDRHDFYDYRILIVVGRWQQKDFSKRSFAKLGNIAHLERVGRWREGVMRQNTAFEEQRSGVILTSMEPDIFWDAVFYQKFRNRRAEPILDTYIDPHI